MKIIVTKEQLEIIRENDSKKFNCDKCKHFWDIEKKNKHPYLCHMCGYDSHKEKYNYKELENFWKNYKNSEITEKWSEKYKKSINCNAPKGFSQRAHCQGKKKLTENKDKNNLDLHIKKINNVIKDMVFEYDGPFFHYNDSSNFKFKYQFIISGQKKMISVGEYYDHLEIFVDIVSGNHNTNTIFKIFDTLNENLKDQYVIRVNLERHITEELQYFFGSEPIRLLLVKIQFSDEYREEIKNFEIEFLLKNNKI
jgi:hypothetical protein